jgi:hypothetical protein
MDWRNGSIEPVQEEETGEEKDELIIEEYMVKMWKRRVCGVRIHHL